MEDKLLTDYFSRWLSEDIGNGDHSSLACIPADAKGAANLLVKEPGIIAGTDIAIRLFSFADPGLKTDIFIKDGSHIKPGDIVLNVKGSPQSILKTERLILNIMQRMSGIATSTFEYVSLLKGFKTKILDTRKTTPGFRYFEKEAVRIGGGVNHRMGLFDMIMLKDNHIDYAGGIENAIKKTKEYLNRKKLDLRIEIEARNLGDVSLILKTGSIDRILLDNFSVNDTRKAVEMISGKYETESSGGITTSTIREYAACGVDYISAGALTHHVKSLDLSLKAVK